MNNKKNKKSVWKFPRKIFLVFFLPIMVLLFGQLCYLSLSKKIYGIDMDEFAASRNTTSGILKAKRGNIFDYNGGILAQNVSSYTVIAYLDESRTTDSENPMHVVDTKKTAKAIADVLGMSESELYTKLEDYKDYYQVELLHNISEMQKESIENLNLAGIDFVEMPKRYYPNGDFASYVIGYAKSYERQNEDKTIYEIEGELGIEAKYDDLLKGKDGYLSYQRDRNGYKIPDTKEIRIEPTNGVDIYLTLDSNIQRFIETSVKTTSSQYEPEWMMLTVMNAKTGDILGTSSYPSFDPNILNIENYESPLVSYVYEPGSTMKTYTYMCAIEKGTYDGSDTYESGRIDIEGTPIYDWNNVGWGTVTFDKGYEYSSNVAIANILDRFINRDDLKNCLDSYGFGSLTNIELSMEMLGDISFKYPIEVAAAGFGQGITTTAIQHLRALTMITNDGRMLSPHIVDKIIDPNTGKVVYESKTEQSEQIVSVSTVNKIKELMYNTVNGNDDGTTGTAYKTDSITVMGKTGTAQIYDNETGAYLKDSNAYIYSFSGIFPAEDPEYIIYAAIKKPNIGRSSILADAVKNVIDSIVKYKNIRHESNTDDYKIVLSSYQNKSIKEASEELKAKGLNVVVIGDGQIVTNQYPLRDETVLKGDKVFLITNGNMNEMPNIIGWSKKSVTFLCNYLDVACKLNGYGYVTKQSISANTKLENNMTLEVTFEDKKNLLNQDKTDDTNNKEKTEN